MKPDARRGEPRPPTSEPPSGGSSPAEAVTRLPSPWGVAYEELGVNYYDERKKDAVVRNAVKRLEPLGYKITVEAA